VRFAALSHRSRRLLLNALHSCSVMARPEMCENAHCRLLVLLNRASLARPYAVPLIICASSLPRLRRGKLTANFLEPFHILGMCVCRCCLERPS
jgi:hypothetical protein